MLRLVSRSAVRMLSEIEMPVIGTVGVLLAISPALLFLPSPLAIPPITWIVPLIWAPLAGWPVTSAWSRALHRRAAPLKTPVDFSSAGYREAQEAEAGRVDWIPGWLGFFERILYTLLIGLDIGGGAAFIGVWIGVKTADGWQSWSKGTTYGRATLGIGLLGNAMSALYGVVAGLVIREYL
jgi:hypothetical protein